MAGKCYLYELKYEIYCRLKKILNRTGLWEILIQVFLLDKYSEDDIIEMKNSRDPSYHVLSELKQRCYTVEHLAEIFLDLRLEEPLKLFCDHEPPVIEVQPPRTLTLIKGENTSLKIEFKSSGFPFPRHVWYKHSSHDKPELVSNCPSKEPFLDIKPLCKELEGAYFCQIYNENDTKEFFYVCTHDIIVTVIDHSMDEQHKNENSIIIAKQPESPADKLRIGSCISLKIEAKGQDLQYEWFEDGVSNNVNSSDLMLDNIGLKTPPEKTSWIYQCRVYNSMESILSDSVTVTVDPATAEKISEATDKIAILFGNETYTRMTPLFAAKSDVRTLAKYFLKHSFKVFCFYNTDLETMDQIIDNICRIFIDEGVYVVFYFGGHGIEVKNQCYMMPVDASPYQADNESEPLPEETKVFHKEKGTLSDEAQKTVCAYKVLQKLQCKKPAVVVMILDTCRNKPSDKLHEMKFPTFDLTNHPNTLIAYATTPNSSAFENKGSSNGIYVSHLKKILEKDLTIEETFNKVKRAVREDPRFKEHKEPQIPWNSGNLAGTFRFSDQIKIPKTPAMINRDRIYLKLTAPLPNVGFKREICTESGLLKFTFQLIPNSTCNLFQNEFEAVTFVNLDQQCDIDFETSVHSFDENAKCWKTAIDFYPEQTITKHTIWFKSFDVNSLTLYFDTRFNEVSWCTVEKFFFPNLWSIEKQLGNTDNSNKFE